MKEVKEKFAAYLLNIGIYDLTDMLGIGDGCLIVGVTDENYNKLVHQIPVNYEGVPINIQIIGDVKAQ